MKPKYAFAVACSVGILFAPHNLIVLGNSAGRLGVGFIFVLFFATSAYLIHSRGYLSIAASGPGAAGEFDLVAGALGPAAAGIFSISSRVLLTVTLATATLAASGFVFNEVYFHRFPNFAFSFLMLGILLAVNLLSRSLSEKIQILLSGTAAAGLLVLSAAGIFDWWKVREITYPADSMPPLKASISLLMLFVGFDLMVFSQNKYNNQASSLRRVMVSGLLIAGTVFCFWGVASSFHVQSLRLAESTIPHIIAAKTILGESGRVIMGLVIISGTGAAVNALLVSVGELVTDVSRREFLPFFLRKFLSRSSTTMILLALATAAMMALGAAGTEALYTCIRGSIILWMLNYAVVHFAMLLPGALPASRARNDKLKRIVSHGSVFFLMVVGSVILIATDDNTGLLIRYFVIVFLGVGLTVWLGRRIQSRRWRDGKKLQSID